LSGAALADRVNALLSDPAGLDAMSRAMRAFAKPDAASRIVDRLLQLAGTGLA
jgi:UDP-N-acetylglucosamine:LPS N-acetylglucosamine transferase